MTIKWHAKNFFFCCFATRPGKPLVVGKSPRRGPFDARPRPLLLFNRIRDHEDLKDPRETASISTAFGASVRRRPRSSAASRPHCQSQELFFALFRTFFDTINAFLFPSPPPSSFVSLRNAEPKLGKKDRCLL